MLSYLNYNILQVSSKDLDLRLVKLEDFKTKQLLKSNGIEGFAETSAISYVNSYDMFFDFIKGLQ